VTHVKCIQPLPGLITKDLIYAVIQTQSGFVTIIDDRGQHCVYALTRFEPCLAPQAAPTFSQMQQIAANVNFTTTSENPASTNDELTKIKQQLKDVLDAVQTHAEGGNIENYNILNDRIEKIIEST
jgi:hypothetical protein